MSIIKIELTSTDIVAWWGAIVATIVFVWDFYKWKTAGPRLRFVVRTSMIVVGDLHREGKKYFAAEATNIGDRPTTITNLVLQFYKTYFDMIRHKLSKSMIVNNPSMAQPLPYVLNPGAIWQGLGLQDSEIEEMAKKGYLVCGLCHSHSEKEIDRRLVVKNK